MDTVVFFICVLCLFFGCNCELLNVTNELVLTDHYCNENNVTIVNNTEIKFVPVRYAEVDDIEQDILNLLQNDEQLLLPEYGEIVKLSIYGCYRLNEQSDNKKRLNEIKQEIQLISNVENRPFQYCIESEKTYAGILATNCGCVVLDLDDFIEILEPVNQMYCNAYDNKNISHETGDIYMFVFYLFVNKNELFEYMTSCRILSNYVISGNSLGSLDSWFSSITFYLSLIDYNSRYGIATGGTICYSEEYINETSNCRIFSDEGSKSSFEYPYTGYLQVCVSTNKSNQDCMGAICPENQNVPIWQRMMFVSDNDENVYILNRFHITLLYTFDKPISKCVSLIRKADRLFVETKVCSSKLKYLCRRISHDVVINTTARNGSEKQILDITLATVCVFVMIVSAAVVVIVFIARKRERQNNASINVSATLDMNNAIELHGVSSSHDGTSHDGASHDGASHDGASSDGTSPGGSPTMPNTASGAGSNTYDSSDTGSILYGGQVPGRMGGNTASQPTSAGQVPGRINGRYNPDYLRRET